MKYVESLNGGIALQIPNSEYNLAGQALNLELVYQPWDGSPMNDKADEHFVDLTIEGEGVERALEPTRRDIITGARMLTGLLAEAGMLATAARSNRIMADVNHPDLTDENRELFIDMDAEVATAAAAQSYNIGLRASDLARRESLILTPPVAEMTVSGLKRVAAFHGLTGRLRYHYEQFRLDRRGSYPQTASQLYDRPSPRIREAAVEALIYLDS
jgi:hypothetical protein